MRAEWTVAGSEGGRPAREARPPAVSVVIPNWNTREVLRRCLHSLEAGRRGDEPDVEIIVVDDGSSDGSVAMIRSRFPEVVLLENGINRGFATSCNSGARVAAGEWLLFLNSDAFIRPDQIAHLERRAQDLAAAAIGPQLVHGDGRLQDSGGAFPRPRAILMTKLGRLLHRDLPGAGHRRHVTGTSRFDWVTGACLLVRTAVFRAVGGFDERLTYVEDVDLGMRITQQGGKLFLTDEVAVIHLGGESFGAIAREVPRLYRDSQRLLARVHMAGWERAVFLAGLRVDGLLRRVI